MSTYDKAQKLINDMDEASRKPEAAPSDTDREAWISLVLAEGHELDMQSSRNLGYYRTEADCECGAVLWWGQHDGDPTWRDVYGGHLVDVATATGFSRTSQPVQVEVTAEQRYADVVFLANQANRDLVAAQAVIAEALEIYEHWNWNDFPTKSDDEQFKHVKRILSQSPTDALQAHDRQVAAKALTDAALAVPDARVYAGLTRSDRKTLSRWLRARAASLVPGNPEGCGQCWACMNAEGIEPMGYVLCHDCGNKRCPRASDHTLDCTRSNEPGQAGSVYGRFVLGNPEPTEGQATT